MHRVKTGPEPKLDLVLPVYWAWVANGGRSRGVPHLAPFSLEGRPCLCKFA